MNNLIKTLSFFAIIILLTGTFSCNEVECSFEDDQAIINDYLTSNNLTATQTSSGLHYILLEEGKGNLKPTLNSEVTVKYKGYFTDGIAFDESTKGTKFGVGQVITGWQEGLLLMKKESKAQFFIPSSLAYGTREVGGIAGRECSVIIFDVELEDFN